MKKTWVSLVLILSAGAAFAQANDPVVMKINGKDIKKSEFEYIYNKNNSEDAIDKRSLEEYITLFKNFKLKVAEAEAQGLDTTAAFHKELKEYRSQLAKPYLETELNENLLKQAYGRAYNWSEISAILIAYPGIEKGNALTVTPADTLASYQKALEIRKQAMQKGADFDALVVEHSDDTRGKQNDRPGYMGWFSGLNLIPVLEIPIYQTPAGQITQPIRTAQGYYILKIHAKKQNPGEIHAAHILLKPSEPTDSIQVDVDAQLAAIYEKLKKGSSFEDLAKEYSQDPGSATRGGELPWFKYGDMVPEFNEAVYAMTDTGTVSQPVKSQFGYHIIKLLDKRPDAPYDNLRSQLISKLERTGSFSSLHQPGIDQLKKVYHYTLNDKAYRSLMEAANSLQPADSLFISRFENNQETLLTINNQPITIEKLIAYLKDNPRSYFNLSTEALSDKIDQFVYQQLIDTEDASLENKYPEFKNLVQEYRDGILLFEVSNREVWDKASVDTIGLTQFFETHKSDYAWQEPHWKGSVVLVKDDKAKNTMQKETAKMTPDQAAHYLQNKYNTEESTQIKIEKGLFTQGQNNFVDEAVFNRGKAELPKGYGAFFLLGKSHNVPENYADVKGLVITDYQDYLEQEWVKNLNEKYPVVIYTDVIAKEIK